MGNSQSITCDAVSLFPDCSLVVKVTCIIFGASFTVFIPVVFHDVCISCGLSVCPWEPFRRLRMSCIVTVYVYYFLFINTENFSLWVTALGCNDRLAKIYGSDPVPLSR